MIKRCTIHAYFAALFRVFLAITYEPKFCGGGDYYSIDIASSQDDKLAVRSRRINFEMTTVTRRLELLLVYIESRGHLQNIATNIQIEASALQIDDHPSM